MKIAFLWNFSKAKIIFPNWRDGLKAALEKIEEKHTVDWYLAEDCQTIPSGYDFLLFWTDSNDPIIDTYINYPARKGLCLSTDPHNIEHLKNYSVIYCESVPVYERSRANGLRSILAFGTDTDFFKPKGIYKNIEYFYPATFSSWKRQSEIAYLGDKLLCVGTIQPDGQKELEECIKNGVQVEIGYFPVKKIRDYYQHTQKMIIPAVHGSERTVLEAMACNILPEITHAENIKTRSYLKEFIESKEKTPRDFVLANYSHYKYAEQLLKGIDQC